MLFIWLMFTLYANKYSLSIGLIDNLGQQCNRPTLYSHCDILPGSGGHFGFTLGRPFGDHLERLSAFMVAALASLSCLIDRCINGYKIFLLVMADDMK